MRILITGLLAIASALSACADKPALNRDPRRDAPRISGSGPDILLIIGDDATHSDLPLYGGTNARTPHLDRLAAEGLTFDRAYVGMSMCVPCRTELYTGLYPLHSGVCWNHAPARKGVRSVAHRLGDLGYRVGLTGKHHVAPASVFPFERVEGFEPDCVAKTAGHDVAGIKAFMTRNAAGPFCLVIGLVAPHAPWTAGDPSAFDPKALKLPPYLADTPETRSDYAHYLAELELADRQVGDILKALEETGRAGRTLVIFTSEQGAQFPGCKWTNWEQGLRTGFVVRWPGKVRAGARTAAMIQYADVLPTLVEIAGGDPAAMGFDGSSFLPVLLGKSDTHRTYAYAMHDNVPEGPPYPIRSVRDAEYRYIRNLTPDAVYIERHVMGKVEHTTYWPTWMAASSDDARIRALTTRYLRRPAEELYRLADDPWEMTNLAGDPAHAEAKRRLSAELDRWLAEQKDPGAALDTAEAFEAAKRGSRD